MSNVTVAQGLLVSWQHHLGSLWWLYGGQDAAVFRQPRSQQHSLQTGMQQLAS
jgi:hypothetical protein